MAGIHTGATKDFESLSFAEQAKSITVTINNLQAAIEHHAEHSPRRLETIEKCLAQVERLRRQLKSAYEQEGAISGAGQAVNGVDGVRRIQVGSPRLAEPERAADFTMDITEESPHAAM
jgi:hypothetical protein